jgi:hypothetical protein
LGQLRWAAAVGQSYSCAKGRAINAWGCPGSSMPRQENNKASAGVTSVRHAATCRTDQVPKTSASYATSFICNLRPPACNEAAIRPILVATSSRRLSMLHKCANPACSSLFRSLNRGKLFLLDRDTAPVASGVASAESPKAVGRDRSSATGYATAVPRSPP